MQLGRRSRVGHRRLERVVQQQHLHSRVAGSPLPEVVVVAEGIHIQPAALQGRHLQLEELVGLH